MGVGVGMREEGGDFGGRMICQGLQLLQAFPRILSSGV